MTQPDPSRKPASLNTAVVVIVMGVSGVGKSTVGRALATALGCDFCEGDRLHSRRNVDKMRHGLPLSDADRRPWLRAIRHWIDAQLAAGRSGVLSCSALKRGYRRQLRAGRGTVRLLFLHGSRRLISRRLRQRRGHFMPASLLDSQQATLQPPIANEQAVRVNIGCGSIPRTVALALRRLQPSAAARPEDTR
jgi:gluconokinase